MLRFLFVLLFAIGSAQAAHITDKLLVGFYAKPDPASQPTKVLPSGTPLDVQKKNGAFSKVRLGDGKEGWVKTIYISNEKPARAMLLELQAKSGTLQNKLRQKEKALKAALAGQTPATSGNTDKLKSELAQAKQKLAAASNALKNEQKESKRLSALLKKSSSKNSGNQSKQIRAIKKKLASSEAELKATLHEARLLQDLLKKTDQTASQRIATLEQALQQTQKKLQDAGGGRSNGTHSALIKQNAIMKQRLQQMGKILGAPLPEIEKEKESENESESGSGFGLNTWSILLAILLVVGLIGGIAYKNLHMRRRYGGFRI